MGGLSPDLGNIFSSKNYTGLIAPNFQWSILNYGRILNNVRLQDARFQGLAYQYQNVVLQAGKEVENGIVGFLKAQERTASLDASVTAAQRTVDISIDQYRGGLIDFTPVVLYESTLASQQDNFTVARADIALEPDRHLPRSWRRLGDALVERRWLRSRPGWPAAGRLVRHQTPSLYRHLRFLRPKQGERIRIWCAWPSRSENCNRPKCA